MPDLIVVVGPTASGKTALGIALAQALNGEIISADARQIYRWMDIGTAKPTPQERSAAPHHLIDFLNPDAHYSAGLFAQDASRILRDIIARGKQPIIVGGAGFYIRALLNEFSPMPEVPEGIRTRLQEEARSDLPALFARLEQVDPLWAGQISPSDTQRIVRGLEVWEATGEALTAHQARPTVRPENWSSQWFGLNWDREILYTRINTRAKQMLADGLVDEVKGLAREGYSPELNALNTFGYREVFAYLDGQIGIDQALSDIQQGSRRYAKRQMTWFRGEPRIQWIDPHREDPVQATLTALERP